MSQPVPTTPEEAARISAQMAEYETMSDRLQAETAELFLLYSYQWAGIDSDQELTLADALSELLGELRPGDDQQRTVAVLYLDPPELIL